MEFEKAKQILNKKTRKYTDKEINEIIIFSELLADILITNSKNNIKNEKRNTLCKGFNRRASR